MRTRRSRNGTVRLPAAAWAFAGALMLALALPSVAEAQSDCAPYISGGPDNPASGTLMGSQSVTLNFGVGAGVSLGFSVTFNLGVYRMDDDHPITVRCDSYQQWNFQ